MDKAILIPTIALFIVLLAIYLMICYKNSIKPSLATIINSILLSSGIVCGVVLILSVFMDTPRQYLKELDIYIFIGGIAVVYVSIQSLYNDIFIKASRKSAADERNA